jgi:hypothetical protein
MQLNACISQALIWNDQSLPGKDMKIKLKLMKVAN